MIYGSVCSGIEAATVAWEPLGWRPVFFAEIEAFPSAVLKHHYPDVPNVGDFTGLIHAAAPVPSIDVLVGGTPCQSFSVAGLRRGLADARGGLTLEFVRLAQRLKPRWIVWENVPGVLSQDGGRAFGAFLGALGELGYGWAYRVLDAQYFGVAQRRRRVFVVGCAGGDFARAGAVLLEPEGVQRHSPPSREAGQRAAPTLAARTRGGGGLGTDFDLDGGLVRHDGGRGGVAYGFQPRISRNGRGDMGDLINALNAQSGETGKGDAAPCVAHVVAPPLIETNDPSRSPQSSEVTAQVEAVLRAQYPELPDTAWCLQHRDAKGPDSDTKPGHILPVAFTGDGVCVTGDRTHALKAEGADGSEDGTGRGTPIVTSIGFYPTEGRDFPAFNELSPTVKVGSGGTSGKPPGVMSAMAVRRLTPVECERLQGFPDGHTAVPYRGKPAADGPRYKALGNSMAVPVMRWIGERIAKVEAV